MGVRGSGCEARSGAEVGLRPGVKIPNNFQQSWLPAVPSQSRTQTPQPSTFSAPREHFEGEGVVLAPVSSNAASLSVPRRG